MPACCLIQKHSSRQANLPEIRRVDSHSGCSNMFLIKCLFYSPFIHYVFHIQDQRMHWVKGRETTSWCAIGETLYSKLDVHYSCMLLDCGMKHEKNMDTDRTTVQSIQSASLWASLINDTIKKNCNILKSK